jgi:uncharacterized hydrophobic protein (TIGR00271 family)
LISINDIRNRFNKLTKRRLPSQEIGEIRDGLLQESTADNIYIVLIVGSCIIATLGLLSNSPAVIIGAMIVAPLMLPIRGIAFAALEGNIILFRKGLTAIIIGTALATALACFVGLLVGLPQFGSEILSRSRPTLLDLGIAVAAGGISGYAKVHPKISASLAGTAIAVALMPPICVIGLGLSQGNWSLSLGATLLYLTNLLGITLSCMVAFVLSGCTSFKRAKKALGWTLAFTAILFIPLGISFFQLIRQARLETSLRQALLNRTITFQRVVLLGSDVNWLSNPPVVRLSVRTKEPITPTQVHLLEEFLAKEMSQPFTLIFEVGKIEEVRRDNPNNSELEKTP